MPRKLIVSVSEPVAPAPPYVGFVEIARSFSYKLNCGNYESRDFFCSQKAECKPEDAEIVSESLYNFCKRQVMQSVVDYQASQQASQQTRRTA